MHGWMRGWMHGSTGGGASGLHHAVINVWQSCRLLA
jgi:hypothetical protein